MSRCERKGHKFEARYSYGDPAFDVETMHGTANQIQAMANVVRASRKATYIHDICTRCGTIVEASR